MKKELKVLDRAEVKTPIGRVVLFAENGRLVGLEFTDKRSRVAVLRRQIARAIGPFEERRTRDAAGAGARLRRYFAGNARALDDQPVTSYGTEFQRRVWRALRRIPAGRTLSYAGLARRIGRPLAVRAVGAANGANPVAIFVPCHRVIASDGSLHGYGGGLARKQWLLAHETSRTR